MTGMNSSVISREAEIINRTTKKLHGFGKKTPKDGLDSSNQSDSNSKALSRMRYSEFHLTGWRTLKKEKKALNLKRTR